MLNIERLQGLLETTGLSANAASSRAGLGRDYVRDLIRGKVKDPSASRLQRLAEALNTTAEYLSGLTDDLAGPSPAQLAETMLATSRKIVRTIEIPINYRIEPGFFATDGELASEINWPVASLDLWETSQWLEHVPVGQIGYPVPDNSLLHVVEGGIDDLTDGDLVVCVLTRDQGTLFSRTVRQIQGTVGDFVMLTPQIPFLPGVTGDERGTVVHRSTLREGDNSYGVRIVGKVEAIYRYLDQRTAERLRGMTRIRD